MSYHQFTNESGEQYGSFETFFYYDSINSDHFGRIGDRGWYWNAGFPGCLPDGEPSGPFETEQDAIKDATEFV